ncbi:UNVERIFIED_CONTAM: hypothetical protein FKN15_044067 [Acipenser sinensis]
MHLNARRFGASTLGARTSTLDDKALDAWRVDARRSVHAPRRSMHASRRSMHAPRHSTLGASTPRSSVHAPRRFDARCTYLDVRRSTLGESMPRRSLHAPRRSTLGACTSMFDASALGARTSTLRRTTLGASTPPRSVHAPPHSVNAPRRSTLRRFDAWCTYLAARRFGTRHSARRSLDARCTHLDARRRCSTPRCLTHAI